MIYFDIKRKQKAQHLKDQNKKLSCFDGRLDLSIEITYSNAVAPSVQNKLWNYFAYESPIDENKKYVGAIRKVAKNRHLATIYIEIFNQGDNTPRSALRLLTNTFMSW